MGEGKKKKEPGIYSLMRSPEGFLELLSKVRSYRIGVADYREEFSEKINFTHLHAGTALL